MGVIARGVIRIHARMLQLLSWSMWGYARVRGRERRDSSYCARGSLPRAMGLDVSLKYPALPYAWDIHIQACVRVLCEEFACDARTSRFWRIFFGRSKEEGCAFYAGEKV